MGEQLSDAEVGREIMVRALRAERMYIGAKLVKAKGDQLTVMEREADIIDQLLTKLGDE